MLRQDYARGERRRPGSIVVLSALLPLVLAFRLWLEAVRTLGVAHATSFGFLVPVLAGVASALWTGERFDAQKVLSAAVVLSASRSRAPGAARSAPPRRA